MSCTFWNLRRRQAAQAKQETEGVSDLTAYDAVLAAVKEEDFTEDSWKTYQAVVSANSVTAESEQAEIDAAISAIAGVQANLVQKKAAKKSGETS